MRRFIFFMIILSGIICFVIACSRSDEVPTVNTDIYFVDAELTRLLPYNDEIIDADVQHMAEDAISKLIEGRDENDKIRRLLPNNKKCITVRVEGNIAYTDILSSSVEALPKSRDIEKLVIYQIVNTLTSIRGIRFVKFTVDGDVRENLMGFYDMRETYKYVYPE